MSITSNFIWTWLKGSDQPNQASIGTVNVASDAHTPSGRRGAAGWVGADNAFYLFGGMTTGNVLLNDLWRYTRNNNQWLLLRDTGGSSAAGAYGPVGVEGPGNWPGSRRVDATWVGPDGKFYLFGGSGNGASGSGHLNDMWRYNPFTGFWTFLGGTQLGNQPGIYSGSNSMPGGRENAATMTGKNGQLYLFGGFGFGSTTTPPAPNWLNDLWSFNPTTLQWTFIKGSDNVNQPGSYGIQGVPSDTNYPGARLSPASWTGLDGSLYIFGGSINGSSFFNDVWKFNTGTNQWAWIKGSDKFNQNGNYGTPYIAAATNTPGARDTPVGWTASNGAFFLFGGNGYPATGTGGVLNDLWTFNPDTNNWIFLKGFNGINSSGSYGTKGVPADSNLPPSRNIAVSWKSADETLFLFGGLNSTGGFLNDLWQGTMPCDFMISDLRTFPSIVSSGQKFNLLWNIAPSIFPVNYQAIVTFNGNTYSDVFTTFNGAIPLTAPGAGSYQVQLQVISRNAINCSDMKTITVSVQDISPLLFAQLPYLLILYILLYMGALGFFLFNIITEQ